MAERATPMATEVLERIRSERFPGVPAKLVADVHRLEHERQLEHDRGPTRADLRNLVRAAVEEQNA